MLYFYQEAEASGTDPDNAEDQLERFDKNIAAVEEFRHQEDDWVGQDRPQHHQEHRGRPRRLPGPAAAGHRRCQRSGQAGELLEGEEIKVGIPIAYLVSKYKASR